MRVVEYKINIFCVKSNVFARDRVTMHVIGIGPESGDDGTGDVARLNNH